MSRIATLGAATLLTIGLGVNDAKAETAGEINAKVNAAIKQCQAHVAGCKTATSRAKGVLVFPEVTRAAIGVGGSYGVGALRVGGKTVGFYDTTTASIGVQLGAEKHSEMIVFLTDAALSEFRKSSGWQAGGNASVTVIDEGKSKDIDTLTRNNPIVAFVFGETGLMGSLSIEGAKIAPYTPK